MEDLTLLSYFGWKMTQSYLGTVPFFMGIMTVTNLFAFGMLSLNPLLKHRRIRYDRQHQKPEGKSQTQQQGEQKPSEVKNNNNSNDSDICDNSGSGGKGIIEGNMVVGGMSQYKREVSQTLYTCFGPASVPLILEVMERLGWLTYRENSPWSVVVKEFAIYFWLFDFYYYCLHRFFLHGTKIGWQIHKLHHKSIVPTPSTGFSFHGIESIITGAFNPIIGGILGFDRKTLIVANLYGLVNTVFVHLGYEVVPMWWNKSWFTKWYLSSQFHDVHHQKVHCNFGGFTTVHDHMFGTVHRNWDYFVDRLKDHIQQA